jgi:hypothetical protein
LKELFEPLSSDSLNSFFNLLILAIFLWSSLISSAIYWKKSLISKVNIFSMMNHRWMTAIILLASIAAVSAEEWY